MRQDQSLPAWLPPDFEPAVAPERSFDARYGLELIGDGAGDGVMRGRLAIRDELRQPFGLLHGGVIAALAESLASWGTWMHAGAGKLVMGMANDTNFLRPFTEGHVHAEAVARHRGRTHWLWEVQARDDQGDLCAITMVNIAIRPQR